MRRSLIAAFASFLFLTSFAASANPSDLSTPLASSVATPQASAVPSPLPSVNLIFDAPRKADHSGPSCQSAKDCRGRLPRLCRNCTNGNTGGCAHWSCIENVCKIKTCDIPTKD